MIKEDTKSTMSDEEKESICYKSKLLNKYFDSYEELKEAEELYKKTNAKKLEEINAKKELANAIETAFANYNDTLTKNRKIEAELYNKYIEFKNKFIEKYGSFHFTYTNKEPKVEYADYTASELIKLLTNLF